MNTEKNKQSNRCAIISNVRKRRNFKPIINNRRTTRRYSNINRKVREQAEEYGHSFERELAYMVVHGFYHLMGYDHIELTDRTEMREKEEKYIKSTFNNSRNIKQKRKKVCYGEK